MANRKNKRNNKKNKTGSTTTTITSTNTKNEEQKVSNSKDSTKSNNNNNTEKFDDKNTTNNNNNNPWSNLNWKKVDVTSDKKTTTESKKRKNDDNNDDDAEADNDNNTSTNNYSNNDNNNNDDDGYIGVCYGLEVLSGDDYNKFCNNTQMSSNNDNTATAVDTTMNNIDNNITNDITTKKKKKKKKKTKSETQPKQEEPSAISSNTTTMEEIEQIWLKSSNYTITLHPILMQGLLKLNYLKPTNIQSKVLSLSSECIYNKTNIIAAAPTGSGKTLAFGLPILHNLLSSTSTSKDATNSVKALIIAPSRELALQITNELNNVCNHDNKNINIVTIVGGLSQVKQMRKLNKFVGKTIIVATPGRLWEIVSKNNDNELLSNMPNTLEYLVIDEVDRMMMCANESIVYPQLQNIFDFINDDKKLQSDNGIHVHIDSGESESEDEEGGESKDNRHANSDKIKDEDNNNTKTKGNKKTTKHKQNKQKIQTFILSATLAMNYKNNPNIKKITKTKHQNKKYKMTTSIEETNVDFLSRIIHRIGIKGPIQSIDLTTSSSASASSSNNTSNTNANAILKNEETKNITAGCIPDTISLYELKCIQRHKDSYTYAILSTIADKTKGPTIIFCNSIQCVKRVTSTLSILYSNDNDRINTTIHALYGNMQQKSRLQALESMSKNAKDDGINNNAILVSTDVASRGIDIPSISTIIHYDVAHTVDTFIHRTGRTARGITTSNQDEYKSISIISPGKEEERHEIILSMLSQNKFQSVKLNSNVLKEVQTRTSLASQIYLLQNEQMKNEIEENFMKRLSKDADIDYDDDYDNVKTSSGNSNQSNKLTKGNKKKIQRLKCELNNRLQSYSLDQDRKSMFGGSFAFGIQNSIRLGLF